jgi:hypothetical protein
MEGVALMAWLCLAGHTSTPDQCHVVAIAGGFSDPKQCETFAPLMFTGWMQLHPELQIRDGTRPICSANPNWLLNRFSS